MQNKFQKTTANSDINKRTIWQLFKNIFRSFTPAPSYWALIPIKNISFFERTKDKS